MVKTKNDFGSALKCIFNIALCIGSMSFFSCANSPGIQKDKKISTINDGYSNTSSDNFTGAGNVIEDIKDNQSLDTYFRRVPGVSVSGQVPNAKLLIRGASTVNGGQEPLILLNGTTFSGTINDLNGVIQVSDIANITVLKDASSTAIYGSRAANGVISIQMKKQKN